MGHLSRDAGGAAGYDQIRVESGKTIKLAAARKPGILLMDLHMHGECEYPPRISTHRVIYVVKVKIGAVMVAHFVGKQPPDTHAWVLSDDAPRSYIRRRADLADGTRRSGCMSGLHGWSSFSELVPDRIDLL
jgi:hypothetical protein